MPSQSRPSWRAEARRVISRNPRWWRSKAPRIVWAPCRARGTWARFWARASTVPGSFGPMSATHDPPWGGVPASHVADHDTPELATRELPRPFHEPGEVIRHGLAADPAIHASEDQIGGLRPAQVAQHHLTGQDHRPGVDLVEVGIPGRRAMGRLEHGMARRVVDVAAGRDADPADLGRERVRQVVAVEVQSRDHAEL